MPNKPTIKTQKQKPQNDSAKNSKALKQEAGFFKTFLMAMVCAAIFRSFFFEPFHIPSSSMKPNLLIGDYIFVNKFSYGYSRYSFPFGLKIFSGRIFAKTPKRGDIVVFRLPSNPSINYVKRLIGLPGDKIQMQDGVLFINGQKIEKIPAGEFIDLEAGNEVIYQKFKEIIPGDLPNHSKMDFAAESTEDNKENFAQKNIQEISAEKLENREFYTLDLGEKLEDNTGIYEVPQGYYFFMGDNRDNSQDSRFLTKVGFVPEENLVGRASMIFLSVEKPFWKFWDWPNSIRFSHSLTFPN